MQSILNLAEMQLKDEGKIHVIAFYPYEECRKCNELVTSDFSKAYDFISEYYRMDDVDVDILY